MKRILIVSGLGIISAYAQAIDYYSVSDSELSALGNGATNYSVNPSMLKKEDYRVKFILPSTSAYVQDPRGFATEFHEFATEDIEAYADFDFQGVVDSVSTLATATDNLFALSDDFNTQKNILNDGSSTPQQKQDALNEMESLIQDMKTARQGTGNTGDTDAVRLGFSGSLSNANTQFSTMNGLVINTRDKFSDVSDKPISVGLLASMGLILPQTKVPLAIRFNNSATGGAELNLEEDDLSKLINVLSDTTEYFGEVENVDDSLGEFITASEAYIDSIDENTYQDDPAKRQEFEDSLTDFQETSNNLTTVNTENGVYVNGEFDETSAEIEISELDSTLEVLGVNIAEFSLATAHTLAVKEQDIQLGATLNIRHLTIFDEEFKMSDFENFDQEQFQSRLEDNTKMQWAANIDVGAGYDYELSKYGTLTAGLVIKDVIPQTFTSSRGNDIKFMPKVRTGLAHNTRFSTISMDIDVTRNEAIGYGVDTQYFNVGAELRAGKHMAIRGGFKNNLAVEQDILFSAGLGFTPFGVGVDLTAWAKPYDENDNKGINGGASAQFTMTF